MSDMMEKLAAFNSSAKNTPSNEVFRPDKGKCRSQLVGFSVKFDDLKDKESWRFTWRKGGGGSVPAWSFTPRYIYMAPDPEHEGKTWFGDTILIANLTAEDVEKLLPEGVSSKGGNQQTRNSIQINNLRKWLTKVLGYLVNDNIADDPAKNASTTANAIEDLKNAIDARVNNNIDPFVLDLGIAITVEKDDSGEATGRIFFDRETVQSVIKAEEPVTA